MNNIISQLLCSKISNTTMATDEYYQEIDVSDDPYLKQLVDTGELFTHEQGQVCDNPPGHCHQSVSWILTNERQPGDVLYTGYALNHLNNEWFQHTFIMNHDTIIEPSSTLHKAYFGTPLTGDQETQFIQQWLNK